MNARCMAGSALVAMTAAVSTVVLAVTPTVQTALRLLADEDGIALIVPGTGTPDPTLSADYMKNAVNYYIAPNSPAVPECTGNDASCAANPVPYLAQFWPIPLAGWGGLQGAKWNDSVQSGVASLGTAYGAQLTKPESGQAQDYNPDHPVVIFGYSQGATVASIYKGNLAHLNNPNDPTLPDNVTFVLIGNPNRPNGGLFERLAALGTVPILDATFGNPTPTDTAAPGVTNTTDIAFQYDGVADFPEYPINVLADLNALAGFWYIHGTYLDPRARIGDTTPSGTLAYGYNEATLQQAMNCSANPGNCQTHGDTVYVTIPATSLPIMQPFVDLGASTGTSAIINPVVAFLQPATQTLIETGYDRSDYGNPSPFGIVQIVNPVKLVGDLIQDVPEGINAATATINDPNHKIPDLPPSWNTQTAGSTSIQATQANTAAPALPTPPKIKVLKVNPPAHATEATDTTVGDTAATETKRPKLLRGSDVRPVRDLAKSIGSSVRKALGQDGAKDNAKVGNTAKKRPAA
jgi:PE-PPE domain